MFGKKSKEKEKQAPMTYAERFNADCEYIDGTIDMLKEQLEGYHKGLDISEKQKISWEEILKIHTDLLDEAKKRLVLCERSVVISKWIEKQRSAEFDFEIKETEAPYDLAIDQRLMCERNYDETSDFIYHIESEIDSDKRHLKLSIENMKHYQKQIESTKELIRSKTEQSEDMRRMAADAESMQNTIDYALNRKSN